MGFAHRLGDHRRGHGHVPLAGRRSSWRPNPCDSCLIGKFQGLFFSLFFLIRKNCGNKKTTGILRYGDIRAFSLVMFFQQILESVFFCSHLTPAPRVSYYPRISQNRSIVVILQPTNLRGSRN